MSKIDVSTPKGLATQVAVVQSELDREWVELEDHFSDTIAKILNRQLVRKRDLPCVGLALEIVAKQLYINKVNRGLCFADQQLGG